MGNIGTYGLGARDGVPKQDGDGRWYQSGDQWGCREWLTEEDVRHYHHAEKFVELYGQPWCGRHRATFDRGDGWVIKVALNCPAEYANLNEVLEYEAGEIPVAECYLEVSEVDPSFTVVRMEKVDVDIDLRHIPHWADTYRTYEPSTTGQMQKRISDGYQIGRTADGRIVAYDL